MKLSSVDKALLITFSGACMLVLVFFFLGIKPYDDPIPEEFFEIPMVDETLEDNAEEIPELEEPSLPSKVATHQAYDANALRAESKRIFQEEDAIREAIEKQQLQSVADLDAETDALLEEQQHSRELALAEKRTLDEMAINAREEKRNATKGNRESTVSYDLKNRTALKIPNPVYTCDSKGVIVLDIQVSANGLITKMDYNKKASSSSNGCLIDQALFYAKQAQFDKATRIEQKGTISFSFQG